MDKPTRDKKPDDLFRHPGSESDELADADLDNITGGHQQVRRPAPEGPPANPQPAPILIRTRASANRLLQMHARQNPF